MVRYLDSRFVAVGEGGRFLHSPDGINWEKSASQSSGDLYDVAFGEGLWLAVGTNGIVVTSRDLESFSATSSPVSVSLYSVAFGSEGFVAVGQSGTLIQSGDGRNWRTQQLQPLDLYGVAYGDGLYLTVGTNGYVYFSKDARDWTASRPTSATLRDVCFANGMFMTLSTEKPSFAYLSLDGISWSSEQLPNDSVAANSSDDSFWFVSMGTSTNFVRKLRLQTPIIDLTGAVDPAGLLSLTFDAPVAGSYSILSTDDPVAGTWQTETVLQRGTTDQMSWIATNSIARTRFFRVRLE